ncbi:type II toxin-antitoxin system RelE/ParE family toxin [Pseudoduganella sp. FT55W]|uniref:Type II toxin-antitoxin system RelE/ParE family toxin n=1 Tax=Duganella rivi TaxID=2666083 RepID=A0A7X4GM77_9BURK|nr:type II toxin-antitoxin system RelE/ParE family toxin [Duganella rivi]MYM65996.1 type II toxin-antitoxin system RelE/ParE family toxin [Duganella rivi]
MDIQWTNKALSDLDRLHEFLALIDQDAAARALRALVSAPDVLLANPRIGELLPEFSPREVRRILVRQYEIRYEIKNTAIYILRVWHTREHR